MILVPTIKDPVLRYDGTSYTLTNAIPDYQIDEPDFDLVRSVIDQTAHIIERGEFFKGSIDYYGISVSTYTAIKALKGRVVRLWFYGNGSIPDTMYYYPYVDVIITSVRPYHRNRKYYYDACIIEFESQTTYTMQRASDTGIPDPPGGS